MSATIQNGMAFAIVAIATIYAVVRFMPKSWRVRLATRASWVVLRLGLSSVAARRVEAKLSSGGACGSCDSCRACATAPREPSDEPAFGGSSPAGFRQIPIRRL